MLHSQNAQKPPVARKTAPASPRFAAKRPKQAKKADRAALRKPRICGAHAVLLILLTEGDSLKTLAIRKNPAKLLVSEANITKAALRLLAQKLVSPEVQYVQRSLGARATQEDIDSSVLAVRKMPWASLGASD